MHEGDFQRWLSGFDEPPTEWCDRLWPGGLPFFEKADGDRAVVALHGYGATPFEVRPVARACSALGFDVTAPLQAGHGFRERADQWKGFERLDPGALLECARREVQACRARGYDAVFAFGISMGGALALRLAAEGRVDAVAVAAPAIRIPRVAALGEILPLRLRVALPAFKPPERFENPSYDFHSVASLRALRGVAREARAQLSRIHCPVLVMQTRADEVIPVRVGDEIEAHVRGPLARAWFDESGHSMTVDVAGGRVAEAAASFFARVRAEGDARCHRP